MKRFLILGVVLMTSGCQQYLVRSDFIDEGAGNAMSSNSALQMLDPWQRYVYDIDLETSSERQAIARRTYENGGVPVAAPAALQYVPVPVAPAGPAVGAGDFAPTLANPG